MAETTMEVQTEELGGGKDLRRQPREGIVKLDRLTSDEELRPQSSRVRGKRLSLAQFS